MDYSGLLKLKKENDVKYKDYVTFKSKCDKELEKFKKKTIDLIQKEFIKKYNSEAYIYFDSYHKLEFFISGLYNIGSLMDDNYWYYYPDIETFEYRKRESNITANNLNNFCKELSQKIGVPIKLKKAHKLTAKDIDIIRNSNDILIIHPTANILKEGEIWFKGWDIADYWVIYELDGKQIVTWSDNGHGFGMDYEISSPFAKDDICEFLDAVLKDEENYWMDDWVLNNLDVERGG